MKENLIETDVYFGTYEKQELDWRKEQNNISEEQDIINNSDDDELENTPEEVIKILGFDPKIWSDEIEKYNKDSQMEIIKTDNFRQLVYGVFLVPEKADRHGDIISHEDVEIVAHKFVDEYRAIDEMHKRNKTEATIVESAIAWEDNLNYHGKIISKGTWFGAIRIDNKQVWEKVLDGTYKAFSVRICGVREEVKEVEKYGVEGMLNKNFEELYELEDIFSNCKDIDIDEFEIEPIEKLNGESGGEYHRARVKNPSEFNEKTFKTIKITSGVKAVVGKLKDDDKMTIQTYLFDIKKFTPSEAKTWLKDHDIKNIGFETGVGEEKQKE